MLAHANILDYLHVHAIGHSLCVRTHTFLPETQQNPFGDDAPVQRDEFNALTTGEMISSSILNDAVARLGQCVVKALEISGSPGFHIFTTQESESALETIETTSAVSSSFLLV